MEFDNKKKRFEEPLENFGYETDEDYSKPQKLAYGNANVNNPNPEIDSAGLRVPEFRNHKSTLLRPNLLPPSLVQQHSDYHTKNGGKSANETGSTEAQNTFEMNDETLALDAYEVIGGDYDVFDDAL
jgi:hypothetical protein